MTKKKKEVPMFREYNNTVLFKSLVAYIVTDDYNDLPPHIQKIYKHMSLEEYEKNHKNKF